MPPAAGKMAVQNLKIAFAIEVAMFQRAARRGGVNFHISKEYRRTAKLAEHYFLYRSPTIVYFEAVGLGG